MIREKSMRFSREMEGVDEPEMPTKLDIVTRVKDALDRRSTVVSSSRGMWVLRRISSR